MRAGLRLCTAIVALMAGLLDASGLASAQEALPAIEVGATRHRVTRASQKTQPETAHMSAPNVPTLAEAVPPRPRQSAELTNNERLDRLLPKIGANEYLFDREAIEALPQGGQTTLDKILLQAPGVTPDSAAGGNFHIRNEHGNVQYRVNGVLLPDGVSGFSQVMETGFIGSVSLVTGALPAQYGLRTSGLVDILSRAPPAAPGGSVSLYGGNHDAGQTAFEYGAKEGQWETFATGRLTMNSLGIENPTPSHEAIHDRTRQGRFFGYASYAIDEATKLSFMTGTSIAKFQIPNSRGQQPQFTAFGTSWFDSAALNENQLERNFYNVVALTYSAGSIDARLLISP